MRWIAGDGDGLDAVVPGLAIDALVPPTSSDVGAAVEGCDLVVVENLLSLPLNPGALEAVQRALRGRASIVRHHDLPWQRDRFATAPPPPDDQAWVHVTINELNARELRARAGIDAVTIYNRFGPPTASRRPLPENVAGAERPLLLHPTRAIPRKNVPAAVSFAEAIGGTYWLLGPPEDGYAQRLEEILAGAACPVVRGGDLPIGDAYAACDVVVYPSTWEGFGNPTIESALARRPLVVGRYPVLEELLAFGFRWFGVGDVRAVRRFLDAPDEGVLDRNESIALEHFSLAGLPAALGGVLERIQ